jgi:hypothetical protein
MRQVKLADAICGFDLSLNGRFRQIAPEPAHLQRMSAIRPCCQNVRAAASVSWDPSHRLLRSAPMMALRHITAEAFLAMPLSLTVNGIL